MAGSYAAIMKDVYFGTGVAYATPDATTIHGTGGSGTDIAGADISIAGGIGTGTGAGGDIVFKTAAAGSTGSTANTLTTAMTIDGSTGRATFGERIIVDRIGIGTTGIAGSFKTEGDSKTSWHDGSDEIWMFASAGHAIKSDAYLGWSDGSANAGTVDTRLYRDSAGVLSLRAGATTLGELQAGILNAIAPAITDTPLIVNGSVGHTADLILANDGSNDVFQVSAAGSGKLAGNLMLGRYASTAQAVVNTSASSSNTSGTQHQIGLNIGGG
ncbi:MAG: hypothetical protein GY903_20225, partial [Fuerstiella sp.]|nr:hypothetical protein [Fuerstiella sp.]